MPYITPPYYDDDTILPVFLTEEEAEDAKEREIMEQTHNEIREQQRRDRFVNL